MSAAEVHTLCNLQNPARWVLNVAHSRPVRLVVFIHGFRGRATATWNEFASSGKTDEWWRSSDMLFVGYDSRRDNISGVADRVRMNLPNFYPKPHQAAMDVGGFRPREDVESPYQELIVVGHSLGGLIARRAMADAAQVRDDSRTTGETPQATEILDARLILFSPASAGFRPAGLLGAVRASSFWPALFMYLSRSSAFTDLQPGSITLENTRRRTEALVAAGESSLRARILWANPDNVVIAERYDTDFVDDTEDGQDHGSVCKPNPSYQLPLRFTSSGRR
ncbi:alpha/beta fold hydrolase [Arthrobacter sp. W4I7]|uniref:alpha/beta fold hydrolase n=1 Tax=Arthrobacter sp. W4I7 TaxID=3042296 RepID=UPI00358F212C